MPNTQDPDSVIEVSSTSNSINLTESTVTKMVESGATVSIDERIVSERLRQAGWSFDLALFMTTAFACLGLAGGSVALSSGNWIGGFTSAGGLAASVRCLQLAKDANDRLDRLADD